MLLQCCVNVAFDVALMLLQCCVNVAFNAALMLLSCYTNADSMLCDFCFNVVLLP